MVPDGTNDVVLVINEREIRWLKMFSVRFQSLFCALSAGFHGATRHSTSYGVGFGFFNISKLVRLQPFRL